MNRSFSRLFTLLVALLLIGGTHAYAQDSTFPRTITDGAGNIITINAKPMHIVSATLGTDEMLFGLLNGTDRSRLTAITANALDPAQSNIVDAAKGFKTLTTADPETILAFKPDLVFVASYTDAGVIKQLKDAGLPVFVLGNFSSIKDIENNLMLVGQAVGEEVTAKNIVDQYMEAKLKAVADAVKTVKPLTAIYYGPDGYSVAAGSTIDEVITRAGGINGVTAGGIKDNPYPQLSDEFIVKTDPDVMLLAGFNSYAPGFVDKFNTNPNFQTLKAIKNKRVFVANDAHVAAVSQFIVLGVEDVATLLYPDAYKPTMAATMQATIQATMAATAATK